MRHFPLSNIEQEEALKVGDYLPMRDLRDATYIGMNVEVLNSYGEVRSYKITCPSDRDKLVVAMTIIGEHPGEEVCLDSSMSDCYDIGWGLLR